MKTLISYLIHLKIILMQFSDATWINKNSMHFILKQSKPSTYFWLNVLSGLTLRAFIITIKQLLSNAGNQKQSYSTCKIMCFEIMLYKVFLLYQADV